MTSYDVTRPCNNFRRFIPNKYKLQVVLDPNIYHNTFQIVWQPHASLRHSPQRTCQEAIHILLLARISFEFFVPTLCGPSSNAIVLVMESIPALEATVLDTYNKLWLLCFTRKVSNIQQQMIIYKNTIDLNKFELGLPKVLTSFRPVIQNIIGSVLRENNNQYTVYI